MLLALVFFLIALPVIVVVVQLDDVSRDLTTNWAETSWAGGDSLLKPMSIEQSMEDVVAAVKHAASDLDRWELVGEGADTTSTVLAYVRTSRVFRCKDDVVVRVEEQGTSCLVTATSRSRVGGGDLGQNPRNLRALLGAIRERLGGH
jgi:uncharacterized protein (DUF1499 family)